MDVAPVQDSPRANGSAAGPLMGQGRNRRSLARNAVVWFVAADVVAVVGSTAGAEHSVAARRDSVLSPDVVAVVLEVSRS